MAFVDYVYGLVLYDFDRATGELSNRRDYYRPFDPEEEVWLLSLGVEFSSNSKYLYFSTEDYIFQIPTDALDLVSEADTVAYVEDYRGKASGFGPMQRGPDCRIYISNGNFLYSVMHVINYPNRPADECELLAGMQLDSFRTFAYNYYTDYRMGTDYPLCDSTKVLPVEWLDQLTDIAENPNVFRAPLLKIFPNPTRGELEIHSSIPFDYAELYDYQGRMLLRSSEQKWDLGGFLPGLYFLRIYYPGGQVNEKLIKQ